MVAVLGASLAFATGAAAPVPVAADTACVYPPDYPGDNAPKDKIAAWMAGGAQAAGIPVELPVMGSLGETGLTNRNYGDSDAVGYFQMRTGIWNTGEYAGYPDNPALQLKWFDDQANTVRQQKIAGGDATYGSDPARYGDWDADVLRPPEQYRGKYQLYLDQARSLIASGCATETNPTPADTTTTPPAPDPTSAPLPGAPTPDTVAPTLEVAAANTQDVLRTRALLVSVTPSEDAVAMLSARLSLPAAAHTYRLHGKPRALAAGRTTMLRLPVARKLRALIASALGRGRTPKLTLTVRVTDAAGNQAAATRRILLRRHA
jgi:hypothetical protein